MSTRAHIAFYENPNQSLSEFTALLYRHSDGYPGTVDGSEYGVLPELVPFLKEFDQKRGLFDEEYAAARTLQYLTNLYDKDTVEMLQQFPNQPPYIGCLGYGICSSIHWDIVYFYAVYGTGQLRVYEYSPSDIDEPIDYQKDFQLIEEITI